MFWNKNKKNRYTPVNPSLLNKKGYEGVYFSWTCFPDETGLLGFRHGLTQSGMCSMARSLNSGI